MFSCFLSIDLEIEQLVSLDVTPYLFSPSNVAIIIMQKIGLGMPLRNPNL